ncbi:MAG: hypothetical protein P4M15_14455 [Alphaproteobacteria bacterium]|nr:hypothetical protein [Alphaproteobacteria bacterium]
MAETDGYHHHNIGLAPDRVDFFLPDKTAIRYTTKPLGQDRELVGEVRSDQIYNVVLGTFHSTFNDFAEKAGIDLRVAFHPLALNMSFGVPGKAECSAATLIRQQQEDREREEVRREQFELKNRAAFMEQQEARSKWERAAEEAAQEISNRTEQPLPQPEQSVARAMPLSQAAARLQKPDPI